MAESEPVHGTVAVVWKRCLSTYGWISSNRVAAGTFTCRVSDNPLQVVTFQRGGCTGHQFGHAHHNLANLPELPAGHVRRLIEQHR